MKQSPLPPFATERIRQAAERLETDAEILFRTNRDRVEDGHALLAAARELRRLIGSPICRVDPVAQAETIAALRDLD